MDTMMEKNLELKLTKMIEVINTLSDMLEDTKMAKVYFNNLCVILRKIYVKKSKVKMMYNATRRVRVTNLSFQKIL